MTLDFHGKTAVVTGGANGIGFAAASQLAASGADVWILDLASEDPARAAARFGGRGLAVDVRDGKSIEAAFAQIPTPGVVIINAGVAHQEPLFDTTGDTWRRTIDVNLTGAFFTLQIAARQMKPRGGAIVLTASTNSWDGEIALSAYNASKAGILGILHTAANELGPYGIRVNAVCPGLIRTRLTDSYFTRPEVLKPYFQQIAMGRGGTPQEVANAMVFLASGAASYITGAALLVDGGQMASKFGPWSDENAIFEDGRWKLKQP